MCAALGIVCGLGYWIILGITVGLTAFVLLLGRPLERLAEKLFHRHGSGPPGPQRLGLSTAHNLDRVPRSRVVG
jgi:hypothetical protein